MVLVAHTVCTLAVDGVISARAKLMAKTAL